MYMPTTREVLQATIALEKRSMALYARFAKTFATHPRLHEFWFGMARDEARHVGALDLVTTVLDFEGMLDRPSPVALDDATVARLARCWSAARAKPRAGSRSSGRWRWRSRSKRRSSRTRSATCSRRCSSMTNMSAACAYWFTTSAN